jgi:mannose-1-phosphate guanylyltransferase
VVGSLSPLDSNRAAIVLAGGDGTRLRALTRKIVGEEIPKQFCAVTGPTTLLEETLARAAHAACPARIVTVVTRSHERHYGPLLQRVPPECVVIQPDNRGTAPAILYALMRLCDIAPDCAVVLFPSDHYFSDEAAFLRHVVSAYEAVERRPELVILLGITPTNSEPGYGWIEPGAPIGMRGVPLRFVRRFIEKPNAVVADKLLRGGSLWNSFVIVARVSALLGMFIVAMPYLYKRFSAVRRTLGTEFERQAIERIYASLASTSFSAEVLAKRSANLAVLPVHDIQWSDLGEPRRVIETLARMGVQPRWAAA